MTDRTIKSAERTIALFELFSATEQPLSVGEIARALGIPQSSTTMLLRNLHAIGYLDFDRVTRRYRPTIRILLLSSWVTRRFSGTGRIAEALDRLHEATGELVILALQNDVRMQTILTRGTDRTGLQYAGPSRQGDRGRLMIRSGLFASITCSAMGRALLSSKPSHEVRHLVRRANADADDGRYRVNESEFLALIDQVRRDGYAQTEGSLFPHLGALAIIMPSPMDSTPLAVSVSMPVERLAAKKASVLAALFSFREQFSADQGWDDDDGPAFD